MSSDSYVKVLCDLTEFVTMHLEEGIDPLSIMMALDQTKFSMMFQAQKSAEAYAMLHGNHLMERKQEMK